MCFPIAPHISTALIHKLLQPLKITLIPHSHLTVKQLRTLNIRLHYPSLSAPTQTRSLRINPNFLPQRLCSPDPKTNVLPPLIQPHRILNFPPSSLLDFTFSSLSWLFISSHLPITYFIPSIPRNYSPLLPYIERMGHGIRCESGLLRKSWEEEGTNGHILN